MIDLFDLLSPHAKALVPLAVGAALQVLSVVGVTPQMTVEDLVKYVALSVVVWLVPNKKK